MTQLSNLLRLIKEHTAATLSSLVALGLLLCPASLNAQEAPYVDLHSVRILYGDQVELSFSANTQGCYLVLNQLDETRNVGQICGTGQDITLLRDRNAFFPPLVMSDRLRFRTILAPIVESNEVNIGGIFELHSITLEGNQVELEYTKSFPECVILVREDGQVLSEDAGALCQEGERVKRVLNRDMRLSQLEQGDNVKLRVIEQPGFETALVNVAEPQNFQSCVLGKNSLALGDRALVIAPELYSNNEIKLGHDARVTADIKGRDDLWSWSSASIDGNVFLSGVLNNETPDISGDLFENVFVDSQYVYWQGISPGWQDRSVSNDMLLIIGPGNYNNVSVGDRSVLVLDGPGEYVFNSLSVGNDSRIEVDTSFGATELSVRQWLNLGDRLKMTEVGQPKVAANGSRVFLYTNTFWLRIPNDGSFRGSIDAPFANMELGDRAAVDGCVRAKSLKLNNDSRITAL